MDSLDKNTYIVVQATPSENKLALVEEKYNFYAYFGEVLTVVVQYFRHEVKWYQKLLPSRLMKLPRYFDKMNVLIIKTIPEWETLLSFSGGHICFHVYRMLYVILKDPGFNALEKYDKNIILWTALLHDIAKRGTPALPGKDPIHPFKSGWKTLKIFRDIFKFIDLDDTVMKLWDELFVNLYVPDANDPKGELIQDHSKVKYVKQFIDKYVQNQFVKDVFWLVFLHQSLPTIKDHMARSMLTPFETEIKVYFDRRLMELMRIVLRNDCLSYLIYSKEKTRKSYSSEIDRNIDSLTKYLTN